MAVTQIASNLKMSFTFEDKALNYSVTESGKTSTHLLPYEKIEFSDLAILRRKGLRYVAIFRLFLGFIGYGVLAVAFAVYLEQYYITPHYNLCLAGMLLSYLVIIYVFRRRIYRNEAFWIFTAPRQNVVILQDAQGETLAAELKKRCRSTLQSLYGEFNILADPLQELDRFDKMKTLQIVDDLEYQKIFEEVKTLIRDKNMAVDPTAWPEDEVEKFGWMLEKGIISHAEYDAALQKIAGNKNVAITHAYDHSIH